MSFPLTVQRIDAQADPEPRPVVNVLDRGQARFPVIPARAERAKEGPELRLTAASASRAVATLEKPDTDYRVSYVFAKESCWRQVHIEDASL